MEYLPTIIVAALLLFAVICIIRYLVRQLKAGHGLCCGDCKSCGHCSAIQEMDGAAEKPSGCSGNCAGCKGNCSGCSGSQV